MNGTLRIQPIHFVKTIPFNLGSSTVKKNAVGWMTEARSSKIDFGFSLQKRIFNLFHEQQKQPET